MKALPKAGGRDKSASPAATCAAGGQGLGILQAMRVITEACNSGGAEMNASLLKMFDGFINGTLQMIAKECK